PPGERDDGSTRLDDQGVLDLPAAGKREHPGGPRIWLECFDALRAIGLYDVGRIALRGERAWAAGRLEPRLAAVHEHDASRRRCRRGQEKRVIAARPDPAHGSRCEAAEPVRLEPFVAAALAPDHLPFHLHRADTASSPTTRFPMPGSVST